MHPVRRMPRLASIAAAAALVPALAATAPAVAAPAHGCKAGALRTTATTTTICTARHARIAVRAEAVAPEQAGIDAPTGGAPLVAKAARRSVRCAAGDQGARAGQTLVVITSYRTADTHADAGTDAIAYACGRDGAWHEVASALAGAQLISSSIVVERTTTV